MTDAKNYNSITELPTEIPLLMIRGAVLLPKAQLPLPIFGNDHIAMISHVLQTHKLVGMVQPTATARDAIDMDSFGLYRTGCVGKITDVQEHEENRLIVHLEGLCRFRLKAQRIGADDYPVGDVDYNHFYKDLVDESDFAMDRPRLFKALKPYFNRLEITPNWEEIDRTSNQKLITALSMACPLLPDEKQALLEVENIREQSEVMTTLIEMAVLSPTMDNITHH